MHGLFLGTKINIRLHRNPDELVLIADSSAIGGTADVTRRNYYVRIERVFMEALRFKVSPDTLSYVDSQLANRAARYYLTRMEMRHFFIPAQSLEWVVNGVFTGVMPLRCFIGLVPTTAFQGTFDTNPLCFQVCSSSSSFIPPFPFLKLIFLSEKLRFFVYLSL